MDVGAHDFFEAHLFTLCFLAIKRMRSGLGEGSFARGECDWRERGANPRGKKGENPLGGNTQRQISLGEIGSFGLKKKKKKKEILRREMGIIYSLLLFSCVLWLYFPPP